MTRDKTSAKSLDISRHIELRSRSRALLLSNPNYFGTLAAAGQAVLKLSGDTTFEELGCVGFHPHTDRLEAVVYVKEPTGYNGDLCSDGSQEYVRFYGSWDEGKTWTDFGLSAFTAWNIKEGTEGRKRLEYAVTRTVEIPRHLCRSPQIVLVRAILSWNVPPPPNTPDFPPVWGNVRETRILIEPRKRWLLEEVLDLAGLKTFATTGDSAKPSQIAQLGDIVDFQAAVTVEPKALSLAALQNLYQGADVPAKRFASPQLQALLSGSGPVAAGSLTSSLTQLNIGSLLEELFNPGDGDTTYEELNCIGYDPIDDSLVGVIRIKRPQGFSGNLCSAGSREYVTFWADLDNSGSFETCLGTTSVQVWDLDPKQFPKGGLDYAVHLPANLIRRRQPCKEGALLIPIRAILSWQNEIPCSQPSKKPIWGNRVETLIHVAPGRRIDTNVLPELWFVGAVAVDQIETSGFTKDSHALGGMHVSNSPFGGRVDLAGKIHNGTAATRFRPMIRRKGIGSFLPMNLEPNGIAISIVTTPGPVITPTVLHADPDGYYRYQDYPSNQFVANHMLASWHTTVADHGKTYELRIDVADPANPGNDIESEVVCVHVDNVAPELNLEFTTVVGDCAHFKEKAIFKGAFTVTDPHFGSYIFEILPTGPAAGVHPTPASGTSTHLGGTIPDPGLVGETFELNTDHMKPCGYALVLHAWDRTNVNSGTGSNYNKDSVGFCLGSPPQG